MIRILLRWLLRGTLVVLLLLVVVLIIFRWLADRREDQIATQAAPSGGTFIAAGDVQMYVQQSGRADGPAVLLVHGTGAWSETWRKTIDTLAAQGLRVIAIDLPPFGFSERRSEISYTKEAQGRRILAALDSLQVGSVTAIGHSFGAGPVIEAALAQPSRFHAIVIVDGALGIRTGTDTEKTPTLSSRLVGSLLHNEPIRNSVVATFVTNPMFTRRLLQAFIADPSRATDEYVQLYQRPLSVQGSTPAVGQWLPELIAPSARSVSEDPQAYSKLAMPIGIVWGRLDTITPLNQANRLVELLPQSQLVVIEDVGHIPQLEDPERFNGVLIPLLRHVIESPSN
jgi:pimeloyl-ACP methyl ester carboxylesterase